MIMPTMILTSAPTLTFSHEKCVKRSMPPATAQNRPAYINLYRPGHYQQYEYRPARVNGVLQWVLRPVHHLAYWIQRIIRRIRAGVDFWSVGYGVLTIDGSDDLRPQRAFPYIVDLEVPRLPPGLYHGFNI